MNTASGKAIAAGKTPVYGRFFVPVLCGMGWGKIMIYDDLKSILFLSCR